MLHPRHPRHPIGPRRPPGAGVAPARLQRHRGPDWSGIHATDGVVLAHERLAVVDVLHGAQPLLDESGSRALAVNGEIYNHRELEAGLDRPYPLRVMRLGWGRRNRK